MLRDKACMPISLPDTARGSWLQYAMNLPIPLTSTLTLELLLPSSDSRSELHEDGLIQQTLRTQLEEEDVSRPRARLRMRFSPPMTAESCCNTNGADAIE